MGDLENPAVSLMLEEANKAKQSKIRTFCEELCFTHSLTNPFWRRVTTTEEERGIPQCKVPAENFGKKKRKKENLSIIPKVCNGIKKNQNNLPFACRGEIPL